MGLPVLILGESGTGKTYSIKNFKKGEALVFSVEKGRLPFKSNLQVVKNSGTPCRSCVGKQLYSSSAF